MSKGQLLGHYSQVIGILLFHTLCIVPLEILIVSLLTPNTVVGYVIYEIAFFLLHIISGFFMAGEAFVYLKLSQGQRVVLNDLFTPLREDQSRLFYVQLRISLITTCCTLPSSIVSAFTEDVRLYTWLYILGALVSFIAELFFSQCYFLLMDFQNMPAKEVISRSFSLVKKNFGRLLYLRLSFIPLVILSVCSFGIGALWVIPYTQATYTNFYLDLVRKKTV